MVYGLGTRKQGQSHRNQHRSPLRSRTGLNCITDEIKKRRWRWLGHVLRMDRKRLPSIALKWTPSGKRNRGRPLGTWRRTIDEEARAIHKTWHEISWLAQDREAWRSFVAALCSTGSDKEWWWLSSRLFWLMQQ